MTDLSTEADVTQLVTRFYGTVVQDELLGPIFNDVAKVDWSTHIPKLTSFWCRNLFGTPGYQGNTLRAHLAVHEKTPFELEHFARWLEIFDDTVDTYWSGPTADRAKSFAKRVASVQADHVVGTQILGPGPVTLLPEPRRSR